MTDNNYNVLVKTHFICEKCNSRLSINYRKIHISLNHKYKCNYCHFSFIRKIQLIRHMKEQHLLQYYKYLNTKCPKNSLIEAQNLWSHNVAANQSIKNCMTKKPLINFECSVCDITFFNKDHLKRHIHTPHIIKCDKCDRSFVTKKSFTNHMSSVHISELNSNIKHRRVICKKEDIGLGNQNNLPIISNTLHIGPPKQRNAHYLQLKNMEMENVGIDQLNTNLTNSKLENKTINNMIANQMNNIETCINSILTNESSQLNEAQNLQTQNKNMNKVTTTQSNKLNTTVNMQMLLCPLCNLQFMNSEYNFHKRRKHNYKCNKCDKMFVRMKTMHDHMENVHNKLQTNKDFIVQLNKLQNIKPDTQPTQYTCSICDLKFKYLHECNKHMEIKHIHHINNVQTLKNKNSFIEIPVNEPNHPINTTTLEYCDMQIDNVKTDINNVANLQIDIKNETSNSVPVFQQKGMKINSIRPSMNLTCGKCDTKFENMQYLIQHSMLQYSYKCDICNKCFVYRKNLISHMQAMHEQSNINIPNTNYNNSIIQCHPDITTISQMQSKITLVTEPGVQNKVQILQQDYNDLEKTTVDQSAEIQIGESVKLKNFETIEPIISETNCIKMNEVMPVVPKVEKTHNEKKQIRYLCINCGGQFSNRTVFNRHIQCDHKHKCISCEKKFVRKTALNKHIQAIHDHKHENSCIQMSFAKLSQVDELPNIELNYNKMEEVNIQSGVQQFNINEVSQLNLKQNPQYRDNFLEDNVFNKSSTMHIDEDVTLNKFDTIQPIISQTNCIGINDIPIVSNNAIIHRFNLQEDGQPNDMLNLLPQNIYKSNKVDNLCNEKKKVNKQTGFLCNICGGQFRINREFKRHTNIEHKHECLYCEKKFVRKATLNKHMQAMHDHHHEKPWIKINSTKPSQVDEMVENQPEYVKIEDITIQTVIDEINFNEIDGILSNDNMFNTLSKMQIDDITMENFDTIQPITSQTDCIEINDIIPIVSNYAITDKLNLQENQHNEILNFLPHSDQLPSALDNLSNGKKETYEQTGFLCNICGCQFSSNKELIQHTNIEHKHECGFCKNTFVCKMALIKHIQVMHDNCHKNSCIAMDFSKLNQVDEMLENQPEYVKMENMTIQTDIDQVNFNEINDAHNYNRLTLTQNLRYCDIFSEDNVFNMSRKMQINDHCKMENLEISQHIISQTNCIEVNKVLPIVPKVEETNRFNLQENDQPNEILNHLPKINQTSNAMDNLCHEQNNQTEFLCNMCDTQYKFYNELKRHTEVEHKHECVYCTKKFVYKTTLYKHIQVMHNNHNENTKKEDINIHSGINQFHINEQFNNNLPIIPNNLPLYINNTHNHNQLNLTQNLQCNDIFSKDNVFNTSSKMQAVEHFKLENLETIQPMSSQTDCIEVNKIIPIKPISQIDILHNEQLKDKTVNPCDEKEQSKKFPELLCKNCGVQFISCTKFKRHISIVHRNKCVICNKKFIRKVTLKIHILSMHSNHNKNSSIEMNVTKLNQQFEMPKLQPDCIKMKHYDIQTAIDQKNCNDIYNNKTIEQNNLLRHSNILQEPDQLNKKHDRQLYQYQRKKNIVREPSDNQIFFICNICDWQYTIKSKFIKHSETKHSNKCFICNKKFIRKITLDKHIQDMHIQNNENVCTEKHVAMSNRLENMQKLQPDDVKINDSTIPTIIDQINNIETNNVLPMSPNVGQLYIKEGVDHSCLSETQNLLKDSGLENIVVDTLSEIQIDEQVTLENFVSQSSSIKINDVIPIAPNDLIIHRNNIPDQFIKIQNCHLQEVANTFVEKKSINKHTWFVCNICDGQFRCKSEFNRHSGIKHKQKCDACEKLFVRKSALQKHIQIMHIQYNDNSYSKMHGLMSSQLCETPNLQSNYIIKTDNINIQTGISQINRNIIKDVLPVIQDNVQLKNCQLKKKQVKKLASFVCNICDGQFKNKIQFKQHSRIDHKRKCFDCEKSFIRSITLMKHIQVKHAQNNEPLDDTPNVQPNNVKIGNLTIHTTVDHNYCSEIKDILPIKLSDVQTYSNNVLEHGQINDPHNYQQDKMASSYKNKELVNKHAQYVCNICNDNFNCNSKYERHIGIEHKQKCITCDKKFICKSTLELHIRIEHDQQNTILSTETSDLHIAKPSNPYIYHTRSTKIWSKAKSPRKALQTRDVYNNIPGQFNKCQKKLATETQFVCEFCDSQLKNINELGYHLVKVHNHKCSLCIKRFVRRGDMERHMHTEHRQHIKNQNHMTCNKKFDCNKCNVSFNADESLQLHMKYAHKMWPMRYTCPLCTTLNTDNNEFIKHMNLHYMGEIPSNYLTIRDCSSKRVNHNFTKYNI